MRYLPNTITRYKYLRYFLKLHINRNLNTISKVPIFLLSSSVSDFHLFTYQFEKNKTFLINIYTYF